MHLHIPSLLVVLAAAVVAPQLGELTRRIGLSIVVLELALGVAIGPQGLGWAATEGAVTGIATVGMAFLSFLAGLEIEIEAIGGKPLRLALAGWMSPPERAGLDFRPMHRLSRCHGIRQLSKLSCPWIC
jgi:Kef-type K+ transport system membrane component KefB